jgi:hypothetical protein
MYTLPGPELSLRSCERLLLMDEPSRSVILTKLFLSIETLSFLFRQTFVVRSFRFSAGFAFMVVKGA